MTAIFDLILDRGARSKIQGFCPFGFAQGRMATKNKGGDKGKGKTVQMLKTVQVLLVGVGGFVDNFVVRWDVE